MIVGVDEVGRGCWAGPVVAGAVLLHTPIEGLRDSKKLTKQGRERLDGIIRASDASFGIGWVPASEVDVIGLTEAVRLAMERALLQITEPYTELIVDGNYNFFPTNDRCRTVIGADNTVPAVSAASILAKVARDHYMANMAEQFPGYSFEKHVGYGTAAHLAALQERGLCALHRRSVKPVQALLEVFD